MGRQPPRHVDDPSAVGRRLREARLAMGLSQRELAAPNCTAAYVSRIEAGDRVPSLQILGDFARRLGLSVEYLAHGDESVQAVETLVTAAELAMRLGEYDEAEDGYRDVLARSGADAVHRARAQAGLGEIAFGRGDHAEAVRRLEQALEVDALSHHQRSAVVDRLGRVYSVLGDHERAAALFESQLEVARKAGDTLEALRFSTLLANVLLDRGDLHSAQQLLNKAIPAAESSQNPLDQARLWWSQSRLHTLDNQPDVAARYARMALDLLESTEHARHAALAFQLLAHIENDRGNGESALGFVEQGYPAVAASGNRFHEALFALERARALLLLERQDEAASVAMGALPLLEGASASDAGRAYALIADVFKSLGDAARAMELYELAATTLPANDRYRAEVYESLAELFETDGRTDEALAVLRKALQAQRGVRRGDAVSAP